MIRRIYQPMLGLSVAALIVASCGSSSGTQTTSTASQTSVTTTSATATSATSTTTVQSNVSLQDLSWINSADGWALYSQVCTKAACPAHLAHTTNGGASWKELPNPPVDLQLAGYALCSKSTCVSHVRFANQNDGYLYGSSFLITTDGGQSWKAQQGPKVETLKVADNKVFRVTYTGVGCPGICQPTLQASSPGSATWKTLIARLSHPSQFATAQFTSSGSTILLALYGNEAGGVSAQAHVYRSDDRGVSWNLMSDPCSGNGPGASGQEEDLISLAAAPGGFFAGLCSPHLGFATFLIHSTDGGKQWSLAGTVPRANDLQLLAAASPTTLVASTGVVTGGGPYTARLLISFNGGKTWKTAATDEQKLTQLTVPAWLGFETSIVGRWIGGPNSLWTTNDGGLQWSKTALDLSTGYLG